MARCIIALALLLAAPAALAQGTIGIGTGTTGTTTGAGTIQTSESNDTDGIININECQGVEQDGLIFQWTISNFTVAGTFDLVASNQSGCPTGSGTTATNVTLASGLSATTASGAFPSNGNVSVQTILQPLAVNCTAGTSTSVFFCVNYTAAGVANGLNAAVGSMQLDLAKPAPPQDLIITAGDGALNVSWSPGTTASSGSTTIGSSASYDVTATAATDPTDTHTQSVVGTTSTRVNGLKNGVPYSVVVVAHSPGDNLSDPSATASGTPVVINDFWRLYRGDGGPEVGGCASGGAAVPALLALVPLAWWRRRRRS